MRVVVQKVKQAAVSIEHKTIGSIKHGLLIYLGINKVDTEEDIQYLVKKCIQLRIFEDENQKMNLSVLDVKGSCLIVSQFTLFASTKKGNRPSFQRAAHPVQAEPLYHQFIKEVEQFGVKQVETGRFGAHMEIEYVNDGPVTIVIDSQNKEY